MKTNFPPVPAMSPASSSHLLVRDTGTGRNAGTIVETLVVAGVLSVSLLLIGAVYHYQEVVIPRAYQAWCKQTGNPKHLSFQEWDDLRRTQTENTKYVPIIISQ